MQHRKSILSRIGALRTRRKAGLFKDRSGIALVEFAYTLPIFMGLGFYGIEVANLAITQTRMSQIALNMADNASRIGTRDANLGAKAISESEINDVFQAAAIQAGNVGIYKDGRSVLSSLEINALGGQEIQWQRCKGQQAEDSAYGDEGTGESSTSFQGMGSGDNRVQASEGAAVMFVELTYVYQPLFGNLFIGQRELRQEAAYTVRDRRQLNSDPLANVPAARKSTCDKHDAILPQTTDAEIAAAQAAADAAAAADNDGDNGMGNSGGSDPSNPNQAQPSSNCFLGLICLG